MASVIEVLVVRGLVPIDQFDGVSTSLADEETLLASLVARGVVTASQVASARAMARELPFLELADYPIDPAAVALVPAGLARRHEVLPVGFADGALVLAMVDPNDLPAVDDVRAIAQTRVRIAVAERVDLLAAIDRNYRADRELETLSEEIEDQAGSINLDLVDADRDAGDEDAPIVRFVNLLIGQAIQDKASDIHVEPQESDVVVRYRIDGVLHEQQRAPKSIQDGVVSRIKIMSGIDIAERRRPQDGRMSVTHGGRKIDLRVATLPTVWGEKVVLRILDSGSSSRTIDQLAMRPANLERYLASTTKPYGMTLITGPTGSGKSTTLYTTLEAVARPGINLITVEDPVEFLLPGISQIQVNPKAGLTFASALRAILRADPDVILIGEIRDHETARIAIESALTGHLVLSTLHTNDAPSAITRLTEMGVEPFLVGSALDCVVAQRLARRLCERCKEPYVPDDAARAALPFDLSEAPADLHLFRARGCTRCSGTGYRGRIGLHEVMLVTEEIERIAVARASSAEIGEAALAQGMQSLRQDGWAKVAAGLTSVEEVLRVAG